MYDNEILQSYIKDYFVQFYFTFSLIHILIWYCFWQLHRVFLFRCAIFYLTLSVSFFFWGFLLISKVSSRLLLSISRALSFPLFSHILSQAAFISLGSVWIRLYLLILWTLILVWFVFWGQILLSAQWDSSQILFSDALYCRLMYTHSIQSYTVNKNL